MERKITAVLRADQEGLIPRERYASYRRIYELLQEQGALLTVFIRCLLFQDFDSYLL